MAGSESDAGCVLAHVEGHQSAFAFRFPREQQQFAVYQQRTIMAQGQRWAGAAKRNQPAIKIKERAVIGALSRDISLAKSSRYRQPWLPIREAGIFRSV